MLDELREQADQSTFLEEDDEDDTTYFRRQYGSNRPFLGMTPAQRFILAFMLLLMTLIVGTLFLLVAGVIAPGSMLF